MWDEIKESQKLMVELETDLGVLSPVLKNAILSLFLDEVKDKIDWIISNKSKFEQLLLKEWSLLRKEIMKMLGLWRDIMESLDKYIINRNFLEARALFSSLRDFFIAIYETIDLIVYRHDEETNSLNYYAWNRELDISNIKIQWNEYYKNEILAFSISDPSSSYETTIQWGLYCKKISLPWWENLILSFHTNNQIEIDQNKINLDIRRIMKLFQKNWLITALKLTLSLINVQYKDKLTWAYNKTYAQEIFKNKKYSTIFIDITDFKHLNDNYWHAFWDEVLKEVVHVLNKSVKSWADRVFRNWWDEFVVLVSSFDEEIVKWVETRIHTILESTDFSKKLCGMCERFSSCEEKDTKCSKLLSFDPVKVKTGYHIFRPEEKLSLDEMINKADMEMLSKQWEAGTKFRIAKMLESLQEISTLDEIIALAKLHKSKLTKEEA